MLQIQVIGQETESKKKEENENRLFETKKYNPLQQYKHQNSMSQSQYSQSLYSNSSKNHSQSSPINSPLNPNNRQQNKLFCQICQQVDDDIKILLSNIIEILINVNNTQISQNTADNGGFAKLMKIIFGSKYKNFSKCQHSKIKQAFVRQIGIDQARVNLLCNKKMVEMAKYCYQIDIISQQVKTYNRHFINYEKKKIFRKINNKQLSPAGTEKTKPSERKRIVEKQQNVDRMERTQRPVKQEAIQGQIKERTLPLSQLNSKIKPTGIQYEEMQTPAPPIRHSILDPSSLKSENLMQAQLQMGAPMAVNGLYQIQYPMHYQVYPGIINGWPYMQP